MQNYYFLKYVSNKRKINYGRVKINTTQRVGGVFE